MTEADDLVADGEGRQATARRQFAAKLSERFRERNYAPSYIARRCRTTEPTVRSWISGSSIPTDDEWDFLVCMSREFVALSGLWREARSTPPPPPDPTESIDPTRKTDRASPDVTRPAGPQNNGIPIERKDHDGHAQATRPPRVTLESRLDDYVCKITGGRIIKISLPVEFSRADASRVYAFLLTQVDDDLPEPGSRGSPKEDS